MQIPLLNKLVKINLFSRTRRGEFDRRFAKVTAKTFVHPAPGPAGNALQIATFYTKIELKRQLDMSNSDRSRWKLTEQTMITRAIRSRRQY